MKRFIIALIFAFTVPVYAAPFAANNQSNKEKLVYMMNNEGKYLIGMSKEQIINTYGGPLKVNRSQYGNNTEEQWIMFNNSATYIYFKNGYVTSFQTDEQ